MEMLTTEPSYAGKLGRYKMTIFVQLNRAETPLPHKWPLLVDNLWSPPATGRVGSFTILPQMEQGLEYRFCD